jgi:catechol 2,3-dioxygenase-like lactoylglutathione lyase family enzyme
MLAYSMVGSNDLDKARKFYGALLADLGAKEVMVRPDGGAVFFGIQPGQPMFALCKPHDGESAAPGNGNMLAISVKDAAQVKAMYDKAISLGATCEGEPGPRLDGMVSCGYVRDLDGNKLNFFCMGS